MKIPGQIKKHYFLYWLMAVAFCFLPGFIFANNFLGWNFFIGSKDAVFYQMIMKLYGHAMAQGEFYPRWFADANAGQGSPVMIFYSPLSYFLANSLFGWMDDPHGQSRFVASIALSHAASGLTAYLWLRNSFNQRISLIFSIVYMIVPYRIMTIWIGHNPAHQWAMVWIPLWMIAAEKMTGKNPRAILYYAYCIALVGYTHLLSLIAFITLPALYVLYLSKETWKSRILNLAAAHLLGFGLCALYLLPMLFNRDAVWKDGFLIDSYSVFRNLSNPDSVYTFYYVLTGIMVCLFFWKRDHINDPYKKMFQFFLCATLFVWFMNTPLSIWIWKIFPVLQYLQFPMARLHPAILIPFVWIFAYFTTQWLKNPPKDNLRFYVYTPYMVVLFACMAGWSNAKNLRTNAHCMLPPVMFLAEEATRIHNINGILPLEYITLWSTPMMQTQSWVNGTARKPIAFIEAGNGNVIGKSLKEHHISLDIRIDSPEAIVGLKQWYFPGWEITDKNGHSYKPSPNEKTGLISFNLSRGNYHLDARLNLLGEKGGMAISLASLVLACLAWVYLRKHSKS